jgi:hypothetical protein
MNQTKRGKGKQTPLPLDVLCHKRDTALGFAIQHSSASSYSSALKSFFNFCDMHNLPRDPTPDTLSYFVAYSCDYISPRSADAYLSGICNLLEPLYPEIRNTRRSFIIRNTVLGCKKLYTSAIGRKRAILRPEIHRIASFYSASHSAYNDSLWFAIFLAAFHGLLRLGELVVPDALETRDLRKLIMRLSVQMYSHHVEFFLPAHKADPTFQGNKIILRRTETPDDPVLPFSKYIAQRDSRFRWRPELWLREDGSLPTYSWFIRILKHNFGNDVGGHSLRSGGATALAEDGVPETIIQGLGRWSSDAWKIYIREHPAMLLELRRHHSF